MADYMTIMSPGINIKSMDFVGSDQWAMKWICLIHEDMVRLGLKASVSGMPYLDPHQPHNNSVDCAVSWDIHITFKSVEDMNFYKLAGSYNNINTKMIVLND